MTRDMARRDSERLAELPGGRWLYTDDPLLDYTLGERGRLLLGYALAFLVVLGFVLLVSLAG